MSLRGSDPAAPVSGLTERLESWKEIATYLRRDVRTVQRWERHKGLPVRRLPGGATPRVYAIRSELDSWWAGRGIHLATAADDPPHRPSWIGAIVLVVAIAITLMMRKPPPGEIRLTPLLAEGGDVRYPAFSPDGNHIAFGWSGPDRENVDLYVKPITSAAPPVRLTSDPSWDGWPAWSPDGKTIAFVRWRIGERSCRVLVIPAQGGAERMIAQEPISANWPVPALSWTPDGQALIAGGAESYGATTRLYRVPLDGSPRIQLSSPPGGSVGDDSPVVSPDGRSIAFIRRKSPRDSVLMIQKISDANAIPIVSRAANPMWIHSGREILYIRQEEDTATLHRIDAQPGSTSRPVNSVGLPGRDFTASRTGDRLAYVSGTEDSDLWQLDTKSWKTTRIVTSNRMEQMPDVSPEGKRIAFASNRSGHSEIWVAMSDGSAPHPVTALNGPTALAPRWSPDGERIAFFSNSGNSVEIRVLALDHGKVLRLTDASSRNSLPAWSRDGRAIFFISDRSGERQVWRMPADGGAATQITKSGASAVQVSVDGSRLFFMSPKTGTLWTVPSGGGQEAELNSSLRAYRPAWNFAVGSKGIYTMTSENPLESFRLLRFSSRFETLGTVLVSAGRSIAVSPDEHFVYFQDYPAQRGELILVDNFR